MVQQCLQKPLPKSFNYYMVQPCLQKKVPKIFSYSTVHQCLQTHNSIHINYGPLCNIRRPF